MKVSREKVEANRRLILRKAGQLFRERGFEAVTVADVMEAAELTHGGFYGYFASKDALIAATLEDVLSGSPAPETDLAGYAADYLSPAHRENRGGGCPMAGLAAETCRQSAEARSAMTAGLRRQIERLSRIAHGESEAARRQAAIGGWAAMVGALTLARMSDDPALADEVLAETRAWIERSQS